MVNIFDDTSEGRAFTLLEILLALAILSTSLTVLMGTVATSSEQAIYSNRLTRVGQLARSKMIDIQYELKKDGYTENIETMSGDFSDEEAGDIEWEAEIQPIEIPEDTKQELLGRVNSQLFGGSQSQGSLKGSAAFSSKLPKLIGCIPQMINRIGEKVRRIVLVVTYPYRGERQTLTLSRYVVDKSSAQFDIFGKPGSDGGDSSTRSGIGP